MSPWRAAATSAALYVALVAFFARELLPTPASAVAGDAGDPVFVAGILYWNATHIPLTDAWWQFPIFHPTRDALAFSEHLLGLAPVAAPLQWIVRDPIVAYNVVALLTFPLCGLAMFALAYRLTRNTTAACLAGLAFALTPYRMSHLPHLQMLACFWAPLALLGLHAYVETRRARWLVVYGAAWLLQSATNAYTLVFLTIVVTFWVLWFVIARRDWAALTAIAAVTAVAALPLAPVMVKYVSVHALHGFSRDLAEMRFYSADLAALLCAPAQLTFWGWLRVGCRPEGELFPGVAAAIAFAAAWGGLQPTALNPRYVRTCGLLSRVMFAAAMLSVAAALSAVLVGPWTLDLGPLRVSASSTAKPVMLAVASSILALAASPRIHAAAMQSSVAGFYLLAAVVTWLLALGPTLVFMGEARGFEMPFTWLTQLPGGSGLRVPARFWLMTTMCLAVLLGLVLSRFAGRRPAVARAAAGCAAALILIDGWVLRIPAAAIAREVSGSHAPRGAAVLTVPMDSMRDIAAGFEAASGGWRAINGYSGYFPGYYAALADGVRHGDASVLEPFLGLGDLHVIVRDDAVDEKATIERTPGVARIAAGPGATHYKIPGRRVPQMTRVSGAPLRIAAVHASCAPSAAPRARDGDTATRWDCGPQKPGQTLIADLGQPSTVDSLVLDLGTWSAAYPRRLVVQTSLDGASWEAGWDGSVRGLLIAQALSAPGRSTRVAVPLAPRPARYIQLTQTGSDPDAPWSVAEIEVRGSAQ